MLHTTPCQQPHPQMSQHKARRREPLALDSETRLHLARGAVAGVREVGEVRVVLPACDAVHERHRLRVRLLQREALAERVLVDHLRRSWVI